MYLNVLRIYDSMIFKKALHQINSLQRRSFTLAQQEKIYAKKAEYKRYDGDYKFQCHITVNAPAIKIIN